MTRKIIAILMTLAFVFAFAACGANQEETTTEAASETETAEEITSEEITDEVTEEATEAASEEETDATEATAEETSAEETSEEASEEETSEEAKAPSTKKEIVEYFNTAVNAGKKDAKSVTIKYMKHSRAGTVTGLPSSIESVMKLLGGVDGFIDKFMGEDDSMSNVTWTGSDKNNFPVENESWASKLTADDLKSATCTEKNGKYTITVTTLADGKTSKVVHGQGHNAKAFNVVMPEVISENIPGAVSKMFSVGTIEMNYPSSTATIVVDKETGHVESAVYSLNWTINIPLGDDTVVLPFNTENSYVFAW